MRFPPALCAAVEVPAPGPRGGGTLPGAGVESSAQARDESGPCGEGSHNHDHSNCLCCVCRVFIFKDTGVVSRQHSICIDPSRKISTAHLDAKHGRSSNVTLLRRGSASELAAGLGAPLYPHTPRPTAGYDSNRSLPPLRALASGRGTGCSWGALLPQSSRIAALTRAEVTDPAAVSSFHHPHFGSRSRERR